MPELAWHGFVDLLALSKDFCEIRDFKTGAMKDRTSSNFASTHFCGPATMN